MFSELLLHVNLIVESIGKLFEILMLRIPVLSLRILRIWEKEDDISFRIIQSILGGKGISTVGYDVGYVLRDRRPLNDVVKLSRRLYEIAIRIRYHCNLK